MNRKSPVISIITATYNRAHLIVESLRSIQQQTTKDWECLIIDDGGNDNTAQVLEPILQSDSRFTYHKRPQGYKKGLPGCRNFGLDISTGKFIIFFDDDDIAHPELLEIAQAEIRNKDIDFCRFEREIFVGNFSYHYKKKRSFSSLKLDNRDLEEVVLNKIPFNSCQILWDRKCFYKMRFKEDLMYAEEWELYSRILSNHFKGVSINKVLLFGRKHPHSNTGEYIRGSKMRIQSHIQAHIFVIQNLGMKGLLSEKLLKHFLQMGFYFKSNFVIKLTLKYSNYSNLTKKMYKVGFYFYPIIRPLFLLKGKILKH